MLWKVVEPSWEEAYTYVMSKYSMFTVDNREGTILQIEGKNDTRFCHTQTTVDTRNDCPSRRAYPYMYWASRVIIQSLYVFVYKFMVYSLIQYVALILNF